MSITGEGDYSLAIKVISENSNIPVILVDACDSILEWRNFDQKTKIDSFLISIGLTAERKITKSYLRKELELIREAEDEPIEINIMGDMQWIYYKDSSLLSRLRYYPIYQLGFISIFMFELNILILCVIIALIDKSTNFDRLFSAFPLFPPLKPIIRLNMQRI